MTNEAGIDYGPDFEGDVGSILKTRVLIAIQNHREAEVHYSRLNDQFIALGDRWYKAQEEVTAARDELMKVFGPWETWERQQLQNRPTTVKDGPGRTEDWKPTSYTGTHGEGCATVGCEDPNCSWANGEGGPHE